ncbi:hypothetical protein TSOC_000061 [Tetrabaena socialis]|uniref:Uncharacterized protein n=1 Tax=Tetrabaena socialis TaxID=47790 RepID=A0A2J8AKA0_9CHLO|nr:hypothetical protein TSOC_000061 [Tetrabaena socialis]|eukprot:PNH12945.1 hypothetical protein TSOC_000061 [Tetrabaena socialis]
MAMLATRAHAIGSLFTSRRTSRAASGADGISGVEGYTIKPLKTEAELEAERIFLSTALSTWLDEEWTVLPEHQRLGKAAAEAYVALRRGGDDDMGSVVLSLASELLRPELSAAFHASFTGPFDVANKLVEMVMMRDGCDVCCTSPADRERIDRVNTLLSSGSM